MCSSKVQAGPSMNVATQLLGGPPSGAGSRHTYQSRFGSSRLDRDAWNHGCWSEEWLGTKSSTTRMPRGVGVGHEAVEVVERAEHGIDVAVVADVVAEVEHRRRKNGREPDGVDAEPRQVVEVGADPGEVTDPVRGRARERAGIDLIHHRGLPPRGVFDVRTSRAHPRVQVVRRREGQRRVRDPKESHESHRKTAIRGDVSWSPTQGIH